MTQLMFKVVGVWGLCFKTVTQHRVPCRVVSLIFSPSHWMRTDSRSGRWGGPVSVGGKNGNQELGLERDLKVVTGTRAGPEQPECKAGSGWLDTVAAAGQ